jgi:hypothetical protein
VDHAQLAAQVSCVVARSGNYLPIMDGPRLTRLDRQVEVIRRNNAAARAKPDNIILAGLSDESYRAIVEGFTATLRQRRFLKAGKKAGSVGEILDFAKTPIR